MAIIPISKEIIEPIIKTNIEYVNSIEEFAEARYLIEEYKKLGY